MYTHHEPEIRTAVDLFCGGGGLTVGIKQAGFRVLSAVEIEPHAFSTYKANHPEVNAFKQDIRLISGEDLISDVGERKIDLLAGCPPCQGFSSLTAKYHREDPRNELLKEFQRLVREIMPRAIMMENVPGLAKTAIFNDFLNELRTLGYETSHKVLEVADFGIPQTRRRLVLLAGLGFAIPIPSPTHSREGRNGLPSWRTLRDAIDGFPEPNTLSETQRLGGPRAVKWHVVRDLSEINKKRLKHTQSGTSRAELPIELRPNCHRDSDQGFSNVYGRLSWDKPSATVTSGCTTLSKGRFGHPDKQRTISVREAATIQTFPDEYIIDTDYMDRACSIVGNALPCRFAEIMAEACNLALSESHRTDDEI